MSEPKEGLLTFRAEGNNFRGNRDYSRVIHWPGNASKCRVEGSGVTIGRGYDMKHRSRGRVIHDLNYAGIPAEQVQQIVAGAGISHCKARDFVKENKLLIGEITALQQKRLFELDYPRYVNDSIRLYNKYKRPVSASWERLHPVLKEVLVDMRFQGMLNKDIVSVFCLNDKETAIQVIRMNPRLLSYDKNRGRINYIKANMR